MNPLIRHLYVHVPFCAAKCGYCAFYSEAGHAAQMGQYVAAAIAELKHHATRLSLQPTTIFFGGGTPSLLPMRHLADLLTAIRATIELRDVTEWTIECNPATVSLDKAKLFRDFGVNRISMGVQALDDELLATIGRVHSRQTALASYATLRQAGFENINLDLMFGLPGQTRTQFQNTLQQAIDLQPEHIATYCLIFEEDTEFWSLLKQGLLLPNETEELAMYEIAMETLGAAGYRQYEISNFARPDRACAHNIAYWEGKDYLGLGPSACSTIGTRRWQNLPDTEKYIAALGEGPGPAPVLSEESLTPELRAAERVAFSMRMPAGVPAEWVRDRWPTEIAELLDAQLVAWHGDRLKPTHRGILFADQVAAEFV